MMDQTWDEKAVFLRALEVPPLERNAWLDSVCPSIEARERIAVLVARHSADDGLLGRTPAAGRGTVAPGASGALGANPPSNVNLINEINEIDEFEVVREIGRGGMGVVYLARDKVLGRLAAVKVLAPHLVDSAQAVERFRQEGRAVAALNHPGIVPVYRAACSGGRHYIAMEYVEGDTLHDRLRAAHGSASDATPTGELPEAFRSESAIRDAARIIAEVSEALEHAHRHGVIHRDVKPSNVIVDRNGVPHLTDFGIAKVPEGEALTTTGDLAGTVHYMSPEQADERGGPVDRRSDVFSLGVVLYELLALRRPFEASTQQRVLDAIRHEEPPDLRSLNPLVPVDLSTICHKALEKKPQNRYQTAAHMAADLHCFLLGDPILARPPSAVRRVRRWAKRHRAGLGAAGLVGSFALVAVSVVLMVLQQRSQRCRLVIAGAEPARVHLRRVDEGADGAPSRDAGPMPLRTWLEPGIYRVAIVADDGRFVETTIPLLRPGEDRSIEISRFAPRAGLTDGMVFVQGGLCATGVEGRAGIQGPRQVRIAPFFIDRSEVSNAEYRRFVEETGAPSPTQWSRGVFDETTDDLPVVGVAWEDAEAYARWLGKRLPTAAEWECAMRAPDARLLPWGEATPDIPSADLDAIRLAETADPVLTLEAYLAHVLPVGSRPDLASADGILHAASNVTEWTATIYRGETTQVAVKGASWAEDPLRTDLALNRTSPLESVTTDELMRPARSMKIGFRCARSAAP